MSDGSHQVSQIRMARPLVNDVAWLSRRMRADEIEQWLALTGLAEYDPELASRSIIKTMDDDFSFVLVDGEGQPIVAGGFDEIRPRVFQTWMIGTDAGWAKHWRSITKHACRAMDALLDTGRAHRMQTYALASRTAAHEWYRRGLGMTYEGTHRCHFANGADAVCYAKVIAPEDSA